MLRLFLTAWLTHSSWGCSSSNFFALDDSAQLHSGKNWALQLPKDASANDRFKVEAVGGRKATMVRSLDGDVTGGYGSSYSRCELRETYQEYKVGKEYSVSWEEYLTGNADYGNIAFTMAQIFGDGSGPICELHVNGGEYILDKCDISIDAGNPKDDVNKWVSWRIDFNIYRGRNGYFHVYKNGDKVASHSGSIGDSGIEFVYLKVGVYRDCHTTSLCGSDDHFTARGDVEVGISNLCLLGADSGTSPSTPSPSPSKYCAAGIVSDGGSVCCASSCGQCGGSDCSSQPGGASQCCVQSVLESGIVCAEAEDVACAIPTSPAQYV